jgi:hypothetical protein
MGWDSRINEMPVVQIATRRGALFQRTRVLSFYDQFC